jgi:hypothetical protein
MATITSECMDGRRVALAREEELRPHNILGVPLKEAAIPVPCNERVTNHFAHVHARVSNCSACDDPATAVKVLAFRDGNIPAINVCLNSPACLPVIPGPALLLVYAFPIQLGSGFARCIRCF